MEKTKKETEDGIGFQFEQERVLNVMIKLARGHVAWDLGESRYVKPSKIALFALHAMETKARERFEKPPEVDLWPEVGTRAMQRIVEEKGDQWQSVQDGRYRYMVSATGEGLMVRIVLSEYLGCEVIWEFDEGNSYD